MDGSVWWPDNTKLTGLLCTDEVQRPNAGKCHEPWNKGIAGQKAPLKDVWAIRVRPQIQRRRKQLALSDLGIDSKLRSCDLVKLRVRDVCHGDRAATRATVFQYKTRRRCNVEIIAGIRDALKT